MSLDAVANSAASTAVSTQNDVQQSPQGNFDNSVQDAQEQQTGGPQPQQDRGTSPGEVTSDGVGTLLDLSDEIARLNSDGDQVVMKLTAGGKLQAPIPVGEVPLGVDVKGHYGFGIVVEQVDDVTRLREILKEESNAAWNQGMFQLVRETGELKFAFSYDYELRWKVTPANLQQMVQELRPTRDSEAD